MARIQSDPSPSAVVLAGTLRHALVGHTKERMRHFFLFLYLYRMLMHVLQCPPDEWAGHVSVKATHQIDVGMRRDEAWDVVFRKEDASVLDLNASAFRRVDASHFCNLGLSPALAGLCGPSSGVLVMSLYAQLVRVCGNTRLLPQRINIGPDRVVDKAHGDLCMEFVASMAGGVAPVSRVLFDAYKKRVVARMAEYRSTQLLNGNVAVAECADIYIATLTESEAPTELRT